MFQTCVLLGPSLSGRSGVLCYLYVPLVVSDTWNSFWFPTLFRFILSAPQSSESESASSSSSFASEYQSGISIFITLFICSALIVLGFAGPQLVQRRLECGYFLYTSRINERNYKMKYLHPTAPAPHIQSNHLPRNDLNFSPVSLSLVAGSLSIPPLPPPLSFCPCDLILVVVVCSTLECSHLMRFTFISFSLEPHSLMLCVCVCVWCIRPWWCFSSEQWLWIYYGYI